MQNGGGSGSSALCGRPRDRISAAAIASGATSRSSPARQANLADELLLRAVLPDRFYREAVRREAVRRPRSLALYLPAVDLLAEGWIGGDVALADLVRTELTETDGLVGVLAEEFGTLVIVLDPGRRNGREGRVILAAASRASSAARSVGAMASRCPSRSS